MTYRPIPEPDVTTSLKSLRMLLKHRNLLSALQVFHANLGDIFQIKLPSLHATMLVGPEANRFILVTERKRINWRTESDPVTSLLRDGILVTDGDTHDALRRVMNPSLHKNALTQYVEIMLRCTDSVTKQWSLESPMDMLIEMRKIALMILTETLFKVDIAPELDHLWRAILKTLQYISPGLWIVWNKIPRPSYTKHIQKLNIYLYKIIEARRNVMDEDTIDLLGLLIKSGMNDELIRDQLLTMLIAGHDTSTALLTWALYQLTISPDVMAKVRQEISAVLGQDVPNIDNIKQLTYLGQVIDEILRLYPPIHLGSRKVTEDMEFNGYKLLAETRLMYSIYLTHRDPKYWSLPDHFDPERFGIKNKRKIQAYTYLPFGGGARNCIGTAFALVEAKVILARILQQYDMQFTGHRVNMKMGATLEPYPSVKVKISKKI